MKISELITHLQHSLKDYGDLDVVMPDFDNGYFPIVCVARINDDPFIVLGEETFADMLSDTGE